MPLSTLIASCLVLMPMVGLAQIGDECMRFPFDAPRRAATSFPVDLRHASVELEVLPADRVLVGRALLLFDVEGPPDSLLLVASSAQIDSVLAGAGSALSRAVPVEFIGPDTFEVRIDSLLRAEADSAGTLSLGVVYRTRAAHFDTAAVWSVGDESWFPRPAALEDRFTTDLALTTPEGWTSSATGMQAVQRPAENDRLTHVYSSPHELPGHRIAFVAGIFDPSMTFAALAGGRRVGVTRLDGRPHPETGEILAFMSDWTGFPYPFERYAQLVRADLQPVAGTSVGIVPGRAMADERARLDYFPAADLAPPVARQWLGSVVSAASWAHRWLEDGLSAYLTAAYLERAEGEDAYFTRMNSLRRLYLAEAQRYARPLVWNRWNHPAEMEDAHSRAKGAWVAHMLRRKLGDEVFRDVMADFLASNAFSAVTTEAWIASLTEVVGSEEAEFARQWLFSAGHPILRVSYETSDHGLRVRIEQTQAGAHVPESFRLPLTIEVGGLGSTERFEVHVDKRGEVFELPYSSTPRFVAVDPESDWLLEVHMDQPVSAWIGQLRYGSAAEARLRAAEALQAFSDDPALLIGLRTALEQEQNALVRAAIVRAAGAVSRSEASERMLVASLDDPSPMVRRNALASLRESDRAAEFALRAAQNERSYYVQAEAVRLLAALEAPNALDVARSALVTPSHDDVVRASGLDALAQLHGLAPKEALEAALHYSEPGGTTRLRLAAVDLLGRLAGEQRRAFDRLIELTTSENIAVAIAAAEGIRRIGNEDAVRARLENEMRPFVRSRFHTLLTCD